MVISVIPHRVQVCGKDNDTKVLFHTFDRLEDRLISDIAHCKSDIIRDHGCI